MVRFVALIALAGCGRIGFEVAATGTQDSGIADGTTDVVSLGHDEDADGVPDSIDVCPFLTGSQLDVDSDGVGDDCDPNPATPGDAIALFATMTPDDQPLKVGMFTDGTLTQLADSLTFGADNNLFGSLAMPFTAGSVRIALQMNILTVVAGSTTGQNQIAVAFADTTPNYFVELNQVPGVYDNAQVTYYDGTTFTQTNAANLANGIHTGPLFLQITQRVGLGVRFDVSWPGEPYTAEVMDAVYQGGTLLEVNVNNLEFEILSLTVITSP